MKKELEIVGIAGLSRAGKDTLAELFVEDGYFGVSVGDITREFSQKRHVNDDYPISRKNLTETSNWLREVRGPDVLMKISLERFQKASEAKTYKGLVCWSIRAPIEVDFILEQGGELIWIDVSDGVRYKRAMSELREGEPHLGYDEYLAHENIQFVPQPDIPKNIQMNLSYAEARATRKITNNSDNVNEFIIRGLKLIEQF